MMVTAAAGSLGLLLNAGRKNNSLLLLVLFVTWVLSPYIALLFATVFSKRWPAAKRMTLYILMLVLSLGSLIGYSGALSPSGTKPAFVFLVVPLISWLVIGIAFRNISK